MFGNRTRNHWPLGLVYVGSGLFYIDWSVHLAIITFSTDLVILPDVLSYIGAGIRRLRSMGKYTMLNTQMGNLLLLLKLVLRLGTRSFSRGALLFIHTGWAQWKTQHMDIIYCYSHTSGSDIVDWSQQLYSKRRLLSSNSRACSKQSPNSWNETSQLETHQCNYHRTQHCLLPRLARAWARRSHFRTKLSNFRSERPLMPATERCMSEFFAKPLHRDSKPNLSVGEIKTDATIGSILRRAPEP